MKDIKITLGVVFATLLAVFVPFLSETPLRTVLGLPLVLFFSGYSLVAALFPKAEDLDDIERIALGFGLSIAVVPLMGLVLNYTPWGIRLESSLISIALFTVLCSIAAVLRRKSIPEAERFTFEPRIEYSLPEDRVDRILSVLLALSVLFSVAAVAYVIVTPKQGEKFTEFYILGPGGMADGYPTELEPGEQGQVIVGVVNHEYSDIPYVFKAGFVNGSMLEGKEFTLAHNQTLEFPYNFTVYDNMTKKLEFQLYLEGNSTVYRSLHLWINSG